MSYEDLADFYLNIVNTLPRPSKSFSPQRIGITLFWDCENIGGSQFLMFLPSIVQRIYDHFADLPHGVEFRSCYVALRECGSSRINCFAIHKIQQYLAAAGIYVEIIPESAGYEAADLSLYGTQPLIRLNIRIDRTFYHKHHYYRARYSSRYYR
jgi:hypothetical protein